MFMKGSFGMLLESIYLKSDCHQILSRKVEMRFCSSSGQNIGQYIRHCIAGCSYQHTVQNSKEYSEKMDKIFKIKKKTWWWKFKMADIVQDYTIKCCAPNMFGCPLYIHNMKKACFVRLKWCPYATYIWMLPYVLLSLCMFECPPHVWMPPYVWMPSCMFGYAHMPPCIFGCPCMLGCPLCLDALFMLGCSHIFRCPHMFGWCLDAPYTYTTQRKDALSDWGGVHMSHTFGCPLYIHNAKKACFVRLRGCPYAPIHLYAPICLDAPPVCWVPPYVWMAVCMFGCPYLFGHPPYIWMPTCIFDTPMFALPHMFGCPLYVWVPPTFGHPTCLDTPCMFGCPLYVWLLPVWLDAAKCMVASKGMRDIQTYWGCPNIQGHSNIWGHPNVWGHMDTHQSDKACFLWVVYVQQASKHFPNIHGGIQTYGGVHTLRGHPNIGVSKHTG